MVRAKRKRFCLSLDAGIYARLQQAARQNESNFNVLLQEAIMAVVAAERKGGLQITSMKRRRERIKVGTTLPPDLVCLARQLAREHGVPLNRFIEEGIRRILRRQRRAK